MNLRIVVVVLFLSFQQNYSQDKGYRYLYVQLYSDSIFSKKTTIDKPIKLFVSTNREIASKLENNLFRINKKCKLKNVIVQIGDKEISINLKQYNKNKFFNISIFINNYNSDDKIIKVKNGDSVSIQDFCQSKKCDIVVIDFPKIITINNEVTIKGNEVFKKYIFD